MKVTGVILGVLVLAVLFSFGATAWAGENWNKISMDAKSAFGDLVGVFSSDSGNYIKTTNFGVGSRIGNTIDYSVGALNKAGQSAVSGVNSIAKTEVAGFNNAVDLLRHGETKKMHKDFMRQAAAVGAKYDELRLIPESEQHLVKLFVDNYDVYNKMDKSNWPNETKASFQKASNIITKTNNIRNNVTAH
jgi:hypothetical protein